MIKRAASAIAVQKLVTKAVFDYNMIEEGDRVLIAVSGGKDSSVLAWALSVIRKALKRKYELYALHISSDFCSCCKKNALRGALAEWDIPFDDLFVPVIARLKPREKMNCYWCSTQRRTELLNYAISHNCNKLALGHHLDDIIETWFMNMMAGGKLRGMPARLKYDKYPVTLIRPLVYLEERQVIACAAENGILKAACTCPYGRNSKRADIRKRVADFTGGSGTVKRRVYKALSSVESILQP
ncbi:MAG: tRNA 2-thiocytidine biosynthesis TtcA family protein [Spirochaetaceae bacterium]|jgi:tRNA 2-thiocytidine biosynthesis protein TtcA|nr:tRNA 2-thiocytidine biosynthesis TtcA family protein [Spirochaetaceae bacterium]